jgi:dihydrofolate synthase/folylpolyglutamate synthase
MDSPAATLAWLTNLRASGSRLGIERMRVLMERLQHPELITPCIHVAGTNGKGSTCAMLEAIQRKAGGRSTGLYTSPHLIHLGERIQHNRRLLADASIVERIAALRSTVEAIRRETPDLAPTFFELMTCMAFQAFAEWKVDIAILETGLGGRLDATNVCNPLVTVITSIGIDHEEYLGNSIESIAAEKAGILKSGVPCVLGELPSEAETVIRARAYELGVEVYTVRERFGENLPKTNLAGRHQAVNAGCALLACEIISQKLPFDPALAQQALQSIEWHARWQRVSLPDGRTLIIDGSHNEEGVRSLEPLLAELHSPTVIVGATGLARALPLLQCVARHAGVLHLVEPANERALSQAQLAALLPPLKIPVHHSKVSELFPAKNQCLAQGDTVLVVGSLYLAGEVLARLSGETPSVNWQDRLTPSR